MLAPLVILREGDGWQVASEGRRNMTKPASACIFLTASSPPVSGGKPGQPEHRSTNKYQHDCHLPSLDNYGGYKAVWCSNMGPR